MLEVELKAWNKNPEAVTSALQRFTRFEQHIIKHDTYWQLDRVPSGNDNAKPIQVRIRKTETESGTEIIVTHKNQTIDEISEVNAEYEFAISDDKPMVYILKASGYRLYNTKEKDTIVYKAENFIASTGIAATCTIELSYVKDLGDFAEIEILLPEASNEKAINEAQKHLLYLLEQCGIPKSDIEKKYYNQLLKERGCLKC